MDTLLRPCSEAAFTTLDGGQKLRRAGCTLLTGDAATASVMMLAVLRRRHQSQGAAVAAAHGCWLPLPGLLCPSRVGRLGAGGFLRGSRLYAAVVMGIARCVQLARCACASDVL